MQFKIVRYWGEIGVSLLVTSIEMIDSWDYESEKNHWRRWEKVEKHLGCLGWLWASYLTTLSFCFFVSNVGIILYPLQAWIEDTFMGLDVVGLHCTSCPIPFSL